MSTFNEAPPAPPPATVPRVDADGKPTPEWLAYEQRLNAWLKRLAAAIGA